MVAYTISSVSHGPISPHDPTALETTIIKFGQLERFWLIEKVPEKKPTRYTIKVNSKFASHTEGKNVKVSTKTDGTTVTILTAMYTSNEEEWFITKDADGNFIISNTKNHAHWELSKSDIGTPVTLEGGHSDDKLAAFLGRLVVPANRLSLSDYKKETGCEIDDDLLFKIVPPPF